MVVLQDACPTHHGQCSVAPHGGHAFYLNPQALYRLSSTDWIGLLSSSMISPFLGLSDIPAKMLVLRILATVAWLHMGAMFIDRQASSRLSSTDWLG